MSKQKKVAIVYDWIDKWGGVERVLLTLHEVFPDAVFYSSYFDSKQASWANNLNIRTSFLQKLPLFIKKNRLLSFVFYPFAFESFNFNDFDVVISVTSLYAKSIITKPETKHICYLLSPPRYLWSHIKDYFRDNIFLIKPFLKNIRAWDLLASQRPDKIISISNTVKERCFKYYKRDSQVIYPPFDINYWNNIKKKIELKKDKDKNKYKNKKILNESNKYYLVVSRLESYKKVDLVIKTFNDLNKNLIIVGKGSQERYLKKLAHNNIKFLKDLNDIELGLIYSQAEALIMPQVEDFGYVSLEAQFFGCPVIAYNQGGSLETIIDGKTGIFFKNQSESSLKGAVERYERIKYNLIGKLDLFLMENIKRFSKNLFIKSFKNIL